MKEVKDDQGTLMKGPRTTTKEGPTSEEGPATVAKRNLAEALGKLPPLLPIQNMPSTRGKQEVLPPITHGHTPTAAHGEVLDGN